MKNLTIFSTSTAYENATLELPNVSLIEDGMEVRYAPIPDYSKMYMTFECLTAGTITIKASNASVSKTISYSTDDGSTWTNLTTSTTEQSLGTFAIGDKVLIKGTNNSYGTASYRNYFGGTAQVQAYGNIMSLIYGDNFIGQTTFVSGTTYNFKQLFYNYTNLKDVKYLILPATTLAQGCYRAMFYNTSFTKAPELPATTLTTYCYGYMFARCTNLTQAPELPATTLADSCYESIFENCTSLTKAPVLPATTLASNCYSSMFYNCTSLTKAPELPAMTLAQSCYSTMFRDCTSLVTAPELLATTLAESCYSSMFKGCTSLTQAPVLPATTLASECYYGMFNGCTSLNEITCLATNISASYCTSSWISNVAATGTFIKHPDMNSWTTGYNGIPEGWTVQDATL